ncbi:hypothetical protein BsWGS_00732 [Bradybaena similaris]
MAVYLILSLVLLVGQVQCQFPIPDQTAEGCYGKVADIFIILDSSTSIYINDYREVLQFTREIVSRLDISQRNTRVGVLTFSDDFSRPTLELNRFQSKADLVAGITEQSLPYRTGVTNTDLAIRYARENPQFRDDITKVLVVVTDGGSRSPSSTTREANLARDQGFYVFVIGVGQYQEEREWQNIASDPDDSFIFNVTNFRVLDQVKYTLPSRICNLPPLQVFTRCNVDRSFEVYFVAAPAGTQDAVSVIDRFVESTTDNSYLLRVSYLLGICSNAENVLLSNLDNYCDRNQPVGTANQNTYVQLLSRLRTIAAQSRREVKKLAVLFIDEESLRLNRQSLINEATNIRQRENIDIIVVDLGLRPVYSNLIQNIAPFRENVITFAQGSVASQRQVLNALLQRTCTIINGADDDFNPIIT